MKNSPVNISIDIETLSVKTNAAIVDIGVVAGDKTFSAHINPYIYDMEPAFDVDFNTIEWHKKMNPENWARYIENTNDSPTQLQAALVGLNNFIFEGSAYSIEDILIWTCGTDFDIPILKHAFKIYNLAVPWMYNNVRDYRTLREMFPGIVDVVESNPDKHSALGDARYQYRVLKHIHKVLGRDFN